MVRTVVDEALGLAPAAGAEEAPQGRRVPRPKRSTAGAHRLRPRRPPAGPNGDGRPSPAGDGSGTGSGDGETPPVVTSALDIKGRHTLQEIADATGVSLTALLDALQLPPDTDPQTAVRDLVEAGLVSGCGPGEGRSGGIAVIGQRSGDRDRSSGRRTLAHQPEGRLFDIGADSVKRGTRRPAVDNPVIFVHCAASGDIL